MLEGVNGGMCCFLRCAATMEDGNEVGDFAFAALLLVFLKSVEQDEQRKCAMERKLKIHLRSVSSHCK